MQARERGGGSSGWGLWRVAPVPPGPSRVAPVGAPSPLGAGGRGAKVVQAEPWQAVPVPSASEVGRGGGPFRCTPGGMACPLVPRPVLRGATCRAGTAGPLGQKRVATRGPSRPNQLPRSPESARVAARESQWEQHDRRDSHLTPSCRVLGMGWEENGSGHCRQVIPTALDIFAAIQPP